ncbi:hypothetical protein E2C01_070130 [Portunus trituberculatus]|uniref:Uncharacterized protein n=1 Tax=Portunus trituberculatus TaxID=210409 RepID=A0A5B7I1B0_PORTR|nr:hypothetical protein [Portunus trituberculatus]
MNHLHHDVAPCKHPAATSTRTTHIHRRLSLYAGLDSGGKGRAERAGEKGSITTIINTTATATNAATTINRALS